MLSRTQVGMLVGCAVLFWAAATAWIRLAPDSVGNGLLGDVGYLTSVPVCWACIAFIRRLGRLADGQMVTAASLVVGVATLVDASVLRWAPDLYGADEQVRRLGAAWLFWGYGVTLMMVLLMDRRRRSADHPAWNGAITMSDVAR